MLELIDSFKNWIELSIKKQLINGRKYQRSENNLMNKSEKQIKQKHVSEKNDANNWNL